jgi:predicted porin
LGAEVIETKDNWNYSRGLLFTFAIPFYHFGARATYAASDKTTLVAYVVNGWNNVHENNKAKSVGLMATLKPKDKLTLTENYLMGNESPVKDNRRHMFDSVATYDVNKSFSAMANYDYGFDTVNAQTFRRRWQGIAAYGKYSVGGSDTGVKIVPRYEWFDDKKAGLSGSLVRLHEGTLTVQYVSKESGTFWTEYRRDFTVCGSAACTNQKIFTLNNDTGTVPRLNQDTIEFGYTYAFTREVK